MGDHQLYIVPPGTRAPRPPRWRRHRAWWSARATKISMRDLPAFTIVWTGEPGVCPFCDGGTYTRERYPFDPRFAGYGVSELPCRLCHGSGTFTPRSAPMPIERPRSKLPKRPRPSSPARLLLV